MQQNSFIANLLSAQHVSGTIMPIIWSSRLFKWLRHVVHNTLVYRSLVWCGAVSYASGLRDVARRFTFKLTSSSHQVWRKCLYHPPFGYDTSWYLNWMAKNRNLEVGLRFFVLFICLYLFKSLKSVEWYCLKLHLKLKRLPAMIQLIKWTLNTRTFYHSEITKAQLMGSRLKRRYLLRKV
jgi:hypothetical protein